MPDLPGRRKGKAIVQIDDEQAHYLDAFAVVHYGCSRSALVHAAIKNFIEAKLKEFEKWPEIKSKVLELVQLLRERRTGVPTLASARRKRRGEAGDLVEETAKELAVARNKVVDLFPGERRRPSRDPV